MGRHGRSFGRGIGRANDGGFSPLGFSSFFSIGWLKDETRSYSYVCVKQTRLCSVDVDTRVHVVDRNLDCEEVSVFHGRNLNLEIWEKSNSYY
jgi:hypothetical protein